MRNLDYLVAVWHLFVQCHSNESFLKTRFIGIKVMCPWNNTNYRNWLALCWLWLKHSWTTTIDFENDTIWDIVCMAVCFASLHLSIFDQQLVALFLKMDFFFVLRHDLYHSLPFPTLFHALMQHFRETKWLNELNDLFFVFCSSSSSFLFFWMFLIRNIRFLLILNLHPSLPAGVQQVLFLFCRSNISNYVSVAHVGF